MLAHSRDIEVRDTFIHLDVAPVDNETYVCSGSGPGLTVRWPEPENGPVFIRADSPDAALLQFENAITQGLLAITPEP